MIKKAITNKCFEIIEEQNLNPGAFDLLRFEDNKYGKYVVIKFIGSKLSFTITASQRNVHSEYLAWYVPYDGLYKKKQAGRYLSSEKVLKWFEWWVTRQVLVYVEDDKTEDLWGKIQKLSNLKMVDIDSDENTEFTGNERQQISEVLNRMKFEVKEFNELSAQQTVLVNEKLDYLLDASNRLNKKDWLMVFLGVLLPLLLQFNEEIGKKMYKMFEPILDLFTNLPPFLNY